MICDVTVSNEWVIIRHKGNSHYLKMAKNYDICWRDSFFLFFFYICGSLFSKKKNNPYKDSGLMCLHIFKCVRQHTSHETQIGIHSINCSEHGNVFSSLPSFCIMSFISMVENWCKMTGEDVDLKIKLCFRIWDLQDPKIRQLQKKDIFFC